MVFDVMCCNVP